MTTTRSKKITTLLKKWQLPLAIIAALIGIALQGGNLYDRFFNGNIEDISKIGMRFEVRNAGALRGILRRPHGCSIDNISNYYVNNVDSFIFSEIDSQISSSTGDDAIDLPAMIFLRIDNGSEYPIANISVQSSGAETYKLSQIPSNSFASFFIGAQPHKLDVARYSDAENHSGIVTAYLAGKSFNLKYDLDPKMNIPNIASECAESPAFLSPP